VTTVVPENSGFVRLSGTIGISGALCLVAGDILVTPLVPGPNQDLIAIRASIEPAHLYLSGMLGALGAIFYAFGAWHVYFALRPAGARFAAVSLAVFACMLIATGIYHSLFIALNFGAQVAVASEQASPVTGLALALPEKYANLALSILVIPPAVIFTFLSGYAILAGKTLYPRWFILLSPFAVVGIYAVLTALAGSVGGFLSFSLLGNVYNFSNLLFFVTSTALLWRKPAV
jgi:hypothetical protein